MFLYRIKLLVTYFLLKRYFYDNIHKNWRKSNTWSWWKYLFPETKINCNLVFTVLWFTLSKFFSLNDVFLLEFNYQKYFINSIWILQSRKFSSMSKDYCATFQEWLMNVLGDFRLPKARKNYLNWLIRLEDKANVNRSHTDVYDIFTHCDGLSKRVWRDSYSNIGTPKKLYVLWIKNSKTFLCKFTFIRLKY